MTSVAYDTDTMVQSIRAEHELQIAIVKRHVWYMKRGLNTKVFITLAGAFFCGLGEGSASSTATDGDASLMEGLAVWLGSAFFTQRGVGSPCPNIPPMEAPRGDVSSR